MAVRPGLGIPGRTLGDALRAGAAAAVVGGAPSTRHAVAAGRPVLEPTLAAGTLLLGDGERRTGRLLAAAVPVHLGLSLGWAVVLARVLPREHTVASGALAG